MRALLAVAAATCILALARDAVAQPPEAYAPAYPSVSRGRSLTQELILERELNRARHRLARIEARRWAGQTPQRPLDTRGFGFSNFYAYRPVFVPQPAPFWSWGGGLSYYGY